MSNTQTAVPVLIVGAGPTGLMLASELKRHGVVCRVVEKMPVPSDKSKALALHARTLEILENCGVVNKFLEVGNPAYGASLYHAGKRIVHLSIAELESPYPFALMVPQEVTEKILYDQFISAGGTVERGVELLKLTQNNESVEVVLKTADGKEESVTAQWLVGCDGAHSTVRKALNLHFEGSAFEEQFGLADVDVESEIPDDEISTFFHEDGVLVFFPFGKKRFRIIADLASDKVQGTAPTIEEMQTFAEQRGPKGIKLSNPRWLAWFKIHARSVSQYRVGRVFLGGDSAHIHSPIGGQGMNTGLQDVYNLAWKLALVCRGAADPKLLDSYNDERHPVGQELLKGTTLATKVATLRNPIALQVRNRVMSFLSQQDVFINRMRKVGTMLAVNYRNSAIVGEYREAAEITLKQSDDTERPNLPAWIEFARGPLPGDRAPDAVLLDQDLNPVQVYEAIRGISHNLLLFDGKPTEEGYRNLETLAWSIGEQFGGLINCHLILSCEKIPTGLRFPGKVFLDPDMAVHQTYAANSECQYLIRPDGYIGFRSQPAKLAPLENHLVKIFSKLKVQI
ncbi:MAG: FAD-dependent monooxygenase [Leptolyngbya sp.]|nr:FAD-dependent monooxygenase [Candidatus Melainabacteria bacterium]